MAFFLDESVGKATWFFPPGYSSLSAMLHNSLLLPLVKYRKIFVVTVKCRAFGVIKTH